jgi:hypothetical protein
MLSQHKSAVHKQAAKFFNSTCGTSKGIVNLHSAIEKADRLLEQMRTGIQYDKNEKKYVNGSVTSENHIKNIKKPGARLI